jgi:hypothetical protein
MFSHAEGKNCDDGAQKKGQVLLPSFANRSAKVVKVYKIIETKLQKYFMSSGAAEVEWSPRRKRYFHSLPSSPALPRLLLLKPRTLEG